ncbi:type II methionyl aminopeptidase [Candidatus Pacearchaeota archaeon]|nr:type II methionyl aminopeptidase [Candidatus Pacearchaeota archaeon]
MDIDKQKIIQAGKIASQVKAYARTMVKKGMPLLEIAEKIEAKIFESGGKPAFPVNLSIDNIAAHYTPSHDDTALAHGLLKVDIGVHIDGWVADTAFSLDLENNDENKKLIKSSEEALENALSLIKSRIEVNEKNKVNDDNKVGSSINSSSSGRASDFAGAGNVLDKRGREEGGNDLIGLDEIGKTIQETIESHGFNPVANLSGHSIGHYDLHAGVTIPNTDNKSSLKLKEGLYAIEPFATTGNGKVHDGKPSNIYYLLNEKNPRSQIAREVLEFIAKEYKSLPFCSRWIVKKLGSRSLFGLRDIESNGNLHHFAQLVETQSTKVSQSEQTILVEKDKITVTTV